MGICPLSRSFLLGKEARGGHWQKISGDFHCRQFFFHSTDSHNGHQERIRSGILPCTLPINKQKGK
jgi:hypothetical protein